MGACCVGLGRDKGDYGEEQRKIDLDEEFPSMPTKGEQYAAECIAHARQATWSQMRNGEWLAAMKLSRLC
jgi:hypothetical protein